MESAYLILSYLGPAVIALMVGSVLLGAWFLAYTLRETRRVRSTFVPKTTVFLPCKGVDAGLQATLHAILRQDYPEYEVICTVEAASDPAVPLIERMLEEAPGSHGRLVFASLAQGCSQKIVNLLAAIRVSSPDSEVFAFLDSDSIPRSDWIRTMVAPLASEKCGAVTGFRWYTAHRTFTSWLRCAWNAMALTFLGNHPFNFCWGGSTAIRRTTFEHLQIARRWKQVLSEDFEITRAVREARLRIHFAPNAIVPNDDDARLRPFLVFARRQSIIVRVCLPFAWWIAALFNLLYAAVFWGGFALALAAWSTQETERARSSLLIVLALLGLSALKAAMRFAALRRVLSSAYVGWRDLAADVFLAPINALLNIYLMLVSGVSRKFWWRDIYYELRRIDEVRILARRGDADRRTASVLQAYQAME
ncbi:MAG: glycosyltransferase [Phycisphaerae bacterium]